MKCQPPTSANSLDHRSYVESQESSTIPAVVSGPRTASPMPIAKRTMCLLFSVCWLARLAKYIRQTRHNGYSQVRATPHAFIAGNLFVCTFPILSPMRHRSGSRFRIYRMVGVFSTGKLRPATCCIRPCSTFDSFLASTSRRGTLTYLLTTTKHYVQVDIDSFVIEDANSLLSVPAVHSRPYPETDAKF